MKIDLKKLIGDIIEESVYGNIATVYHRTDEYALGEILKGGFKADAGKRQAVGKGTYCAYELNDLMKSYLVEGYGEYIIKAKISLYGMLILDYDVAQTVYGDAHTVVDQFNLLSNTKITDEIIEMSDELSEDYMRGNSGGIAMMFNRRSPEQIKDFAGIIYTSGERVAIVFDDKSITPMAYAKSTNVDDELEWTSVLSPSSVKRSTMYTTTKPYSRDKQV